MKKAQAILLDYMGRFSQHCWFASWSSDTEYALWYLASKGGGSIDEDNRQATGCGWILSEKEATELLNLSKAAKGWWIFDDEIRHNRFVSIQEWEDIYKGYHPQ